MASTAQGTLSAELGTSLDQLRQKSTLSGRGFVILIDESGQPRQIWSQENEAVSDFHPSMTICHSSTPLEQLNRMNDNDSDWLALTRDGKLEEVLFKTELLSRCWIPLSVPYLAGKEAQYLKECVDTGWVSSVGRFVTRFEELGAEISGVRHSVATSTGTAALHLALMLAGVEPGDEVVVPSLTFIATANATRYLGAFPAFIDVDPSCWQLDPRCLEDFLTHQCSWREGRLRNKATGRTVRAILPVHLLGQPCAMDEILALARRFELPVIEDSAEAFGSLYRGRPCGSLGDLAALSFNGNKIVTAGGGGMVLTNDEKRAARARYLSTQARDDAIEYLHLETGYNYRLTNIAAAVGLAQLEQLEFFVRKKREIFRRYRQALADIHGVAWQAEPEDTLSNRWLTAMLLNDRVALSRQELWARLRREAVDSRPLFTPLHTLPPFTDCFRSDTMTISESLHRNVLCLPSSVGLTEEEQERVIATLQQALSRRPR